MSNGIVFLATFFPSFTANARSKVLLKTLKKKKQVKLNHLQQRSPFVTKITFCQQSFALDTALRCTYNGTNKQQELIEALHMILLLSFSWKDNAFIQFRWRKMKLIHSWHSFKQRTKLATKDSQKKSHVFYFYFAPAQKILKHGIPFLSGCLRSKANSYWSVRPPLLSSRALGNVVDQPLGEPKKLKNKIKKERKKQAKDVYRAISLQTNIIERGPTTHCRDLEKCILPLLEFYMRFPTMRQWHFLGF